MMGKIRNILRRGVDRFLQSRHVSQELRELFFTSTKLVLKQVIRGGASGGTGSVNAEGVLGRCTAIPGKQRVLVDVSMVSIMNARSGIQRVVVRLLDAMMNAEDVLFVPVAISVGNVCYVEYHKADCTFHVGNPVEVMPNDILLMLDSSWDSYHFLLKFFDAIRDEGGKVFITVYDLIPILHPEYTAGNMAQIFAHWLDTAIREADGMLCISRSVAVQLRDYIANKPDLRYDHALKIGHFVLGADFVDVSGSDTPSQLSDVFLKCREKTKFLSVSTIEPRKNYGFMLDVMDRLWAAGFDVCYFIVGKKGWKVDGFCRRVLSHPELDRRLFWFQSADDAMLQAIYKEADILLNLSIAEGYGLSLVEGAHYRCSVIASDIPVFREVITDETTLFCSLDSADAAAAQIGDRLRSSAFVPSTARTYRWNDALKRLQEVISGGRWDDDLSDFMPSKK